MPVLIAPAPFSEFDLGNGVVLRADHRRILRDVPTEHLEGLINSGCAAVPPVIVIHAFPEPGLSAHCHACGAMLEPGPDDDQYNWMRKGEILDFIYAHIQHAENLIDGWDRFPARKLIHKQKEQTRSVPEEGYVFLQPGIVEPFVAPTANRPAFLRYA